MKNILLITYYFPPIPEIASLRLNGLFKYLPNYGYHVIVLTPKYTNRQTNPEIIETEYPGNISSRIKRLFFPKSYTNNNLNSKTIEKKNTLISFAKQVFEEILIYPDDQKSWYPYGVERGLDVIKNNNIDVILSSSGPVTCHRIAKELKLRSGLPWIADFRDLWTQNHSYPHSWLRKQIEEKLELNTLKPANALVTVSKPLKNKLKKLHLNHPIHIIPNGFDPEEFNFDVKQNDIFTISYAGRLYQDKQDPILLFKAISELIAVNKINPSQIRVDFYGQQWNWLDKLIKQCNLQQIAVQNGIRDRSEILKIQKASHLLLLLGWNDESGEGVLTGKIFEYLALKRPILALAAENSAIQYLLKKTKAGTCHNQINTLKTYLENSYINFKTKQPIAYQAINEEINKYSHIEMAKHFAEVLKSVA